jgi:phenylacetic acid degradation operon negative regulatory protein
VQIRPLSARSVVLSLLLGAHPPELAVRDLVTVGEHFGIAEPTLRVALTRMVAAGDLDRTDATYRLSARMLERQRRQDVALEPDRVEWAGDWELVVVTSAGRSAGDRAELRASMVGL